MESTDKTQWKQVAMLPHLLISNTGAVFSTKLNRELKPRTCGPKGKEYLAIGYRTNGSSSNAKVHRLVADAFLPNPEGKPCVNHKDGNKLNNHVDNLEWVTYSENTLHAIDTGLNPKRGELNHNAKFGNSQAEEIKRLHAKGASQERLARVYGVSQSTISRLVNQVTWKAI